MRVEIEKELTISDKLHLITMLGMRHAEEILSRLFTLHVPRYSYLLLA